MNKNKKYLSLTSLTWVLSLMFLWSCDATESDRERELSRVDSAVRNSARAQALAMQQADSLASSAIYATDTTKMLRSLLEAAEAYRPLDLSKSLKILQQAHSISLNTSGHRKDSLTVLMRLASLYNSEGRMLKEASDIFEDMEPEEKDSMMKLEYFILGVQINRNLAERSLDTFLKDSYTKQASAYRDSVLKIDPRSSIIGANRQIERGNPEKALEIMLESKPADPERLGPYYHYLANIYKLLEEPDSQLICLAKAAADDLEHGVREYKALPELAEMLQKNDLDRAYLYISRSREDAILSESSLRRQEIGPRYSVISNAYADREGQKREVVGLISICLFIFLISVGAWVLMLRKKNRMLSLQSRELRYSRDYMDKANIALEQANSRLEEESRVKESYIRGFMELCLSYLSKMEAYRAKLGSIAAKGDLKKVADAINNTRYVNQEITEFYKNFDKTFFSLYPDFLSILNKFLRKEHQYPSDIKISTEIRVYALIWLGIDSSGEIAKFLRCSESTVYNYRTIMRNRAKDREKFEADFISVSLERRHI